MDFESMYDEFYRDVYRYVLSMVKKTDEAEEITQETFTKAIASIKSFDGKKDIRAWLFTIAKNTYISKYRKEKKVILCGKDEFSVNQDSVSFTDDLEDKETAFIIHKFLHTMDEPYKEVFYLRVFGELDFQKIGSLFGKSDSWARVTFYRAKNQIKKRMEDIEYE
ncbi:MAG: sigma-70 family RNA polymerase sigma factor [Lachnospiraceae bacterium]|nr:sigma-70 family RNA polymerase sigma factor [Lachnospiraceae bacterium]